MARFVKFSKTHSKWSSIGKILHNLETFYMFYITFDSRQSLHFYFSLSFSHSNFLSNVWSLYTSVYGGVNFRSQIVHSHLSIDISNYRSGSYNTWVNCHKTPAPHTLSLSPIGPYHRRILMRDLIRLFKSRPSGCVSMTWYWWGNKYTLYEGYTRCSLLNASFDGRKKTNISDNRLVRGIYTHSSSKNVYLSIKPELPILFKLMQVLTESRNEYTFRDSIQT